MSTKIRIIRFSGQYSDSPKEHAADARTLFDLAVKLQATAVTGSEAGAAAGDYRQDLVDEAHSHHYHGLIHRTGDWVALDMRQMYKFDHGFEGPWIEGTHGLGAAHGGHSPRGCPWLSGELLDGPEIGRLTFGSQHWLTEKSIEATGVTNDVMREGTARWAREHSNGIDKCFLSADVNEHDDRLDVFRGDPLTSIADELGKHPATHGVNIQHGSVIDVIASCDRDGKVKGLDYRVLDDRKVKMFGDHFILVADYEVD